MSLIHICQVCDINSLEPICVMWKSITMNNPYESFFFHLIHNIADQGIISDFEKKFISIHPEVTIKLYYKDLTIQIYKNTLNHVPIASMLRLYIPDILNDIQKVLYLDTDVIITGNLEYIWCLDCGETGLCLKTSIHPLWKERNGHRCGNAGVILMNLNTLRNNNFTQKVIAFNLENPEDDQALINRYAQGKYNDLTPEMNIFINQDDDTYETPIIYHLVGNKKPWKSLENNILFELWHSYGRISRPIVRQNDKGAGIGLLIYDTTNLGDWTQTAASLYVWWVHFKRPDTFKNFVESCIVKSEIGPYPIRWINRDRISTYEKPDGINKLVVLCNAWWMHKHNNEYCFIPQDFIKPIYISVHIANVGIITDKVIKHLKTHEPIGCRDNSTQKLLESKGVKAYYSGCLTMLLNLRDIKLGFVPNNNYVGNKVSVDYKHETTRNFIRLTQLMKDRNNKYNIIITLQRCFDLLLSDKILTTRLHIWLPLICNKANIILMNVKTNKQFESGDCDNQGQKINRFSGIVETVKHKSKLEVFKCLLFNNTIYEINKQLNLIPTG